jgi:hypothetical protein
MKPITGLILIFAGLLMAAYGALPLVFMVWAFITGRPLSDVHGRTCLLIAGGALVIACGWQFVKGPESSR